MPQKTGLYQFVPTVAFPPPQRLQGKGNPSSPRTRRPMWPILPATSHLRLRSGGFFTPPAQHTAHAAVPYRTDVDPSGTSSCRAHFGAGADLDERDGAAVRLCALDQVVAPGVARRDQAGPDDLQVGDLLV